MRIQSGARGKKVVKSWATKRAATAKGGAAPIGAALSRAASEHTRTMLKLGAASVVSLVLLADFGSFAFARHPLTPDRIQVSGAISMPAEGVREHIHRRLTATGQVSLLTADLGDLARWLESRVPAFASVEIVSNLANGTLDVAVAERRPVAKLALGGAVHYLSDDGVVFPVYVRLNRELPLVTGFPPSGANPGSRITGTPVGAGLSAALGAMSPLVYSQTEQIQIFNPNHFDLKLSGGTVVKIDPATYVVKQEQLERILRTRQRESLAYIDLRFVRVVVKDRQVK